jgi:predicted RNA-binding protein with PIN domain
MPNWLVDGMNVVGSRPDGWWRDRTGAMARLAGRLAAWAEQGGEPVAVVFDGRPRDLGLPAGAPLEVAFADRGGRDAADAAIVARVAAAADPAALRVVTSDGALAAAVRAHGAEVEGAGAFLGRLDAAEG